MIQQSQGSWGCCQTQCVCFSYCISAHTTSAAPNEAVCLPQHALTTTTLQEYWPGRSCLWGAQGGYSTDFILSPSYFHLLVCLIKWHCQICGAQTGTRNFFRRSTLMQAEHLAFCWIVHIRKSTDKKILSNTSFICVCVCGILLFLKLEGELRNY